MSTTQTVFNELSCLNMLQLAGCLPDYTTYARQVSPGMDRLPMLGFDDIYYNDD